MANTLPRLHGDPKLNDPKLLKHMCPKCKQVRDWVVTRTKEGYTKKCKTCGISINVKKPVVENKTAPKVAQKTVQTKPKK